MTHEHDYIDPIRGPQRISDEGFAYDCPDCREFGVHDEGGLEWAEHDNRVAGTGLPFGCAA